MTANLLVAAIIVILLPLKNITLQNLTNKPMKIKQKDTAIQSYHSLDAEKIEKEEAKILQAIELGYCTRQTICNHTGIQISNVSRALNTLEYKKGKIIVADKKPCPISKKTVRHFAINYDKYIF